MNAFLHQATLTRAEADLAAAKARLADYELQVRAGKLPKLFIAAGTKAVQRWADIVECLRAGRAA